MTQIPEKIYLQTHQDDGELIADIRDATWCKDKINDTDIEYTRANTVTTPDAIQIIDKFWKGEYYPGSEEAAAAINALSKNTSTPIIHASGDAVSFAKWVMDNYDDNGFEELHNRAKAVVDNAIPTSEIDEALEALDFLCQDIEFNCNKELKIRSVLQKMKGNMK